jgi:hypothetical protein
MTVTDAVHSPVLKLTRTRHHEDSRHQQRGRGISPEVALRISFGFLWGFWRLWDGNGGVVQGWVNGSVAWMTESAQSAMHFLVALLPSTAAAAVGGALGFRR